MHERSGAIGGLIGNFRSMSGLAGYAAGCFLLLIALFPPSLKAEAITVAVASNFSVVMDELTSVFMSQGGDEVVIAPGSSGRHYAQIVNGAPFELFFSADAARPQALEEAGHAIAGSRFTYALGQLALWSLEYRQVDEQALRSGDFAFLAIANPRLAPYGRAAREVLENLGLWEQLQGKIVMGENISQAYSFALGGNADLGLIAYSQLVYGDYRQVGNHWVIPASLHQAIEQQAVLLKDKAEAWEFLAFVQSEQGRQLIRRHGYETP